jgi:hypothetical protein
MHNRPLARCRPKRGDHGRSRTLERINRGGGDGAPSHQVGELSSANARWVTSGGDRADRAEPRFRHAKLCEGRMQWLAQEAREAEAIGRAPLQNDKALPCGMAEREYLRRQIVDEGLR